MKTVMFLLFCTLISACTSFQKTANDTEKGIVRIENGLTEVLQIVGKKNPAYSIKSRLKHYNVPGVSVAVAYEGKVLWRKAYGMADIAQSRAMSTNTMLLAGSISKPLAALRALQLHDQGRFLLDENINTYLTSWTLPDNEFTKTEKVTLRRILNHTAGLTVWGFPGYDKGDDIPSVIEVLEGKGNTDPVRVHKTPGADWQYSGGGYTIMQLAIENIEKLSFAESMQQNVLKPINMDKSTYQNPLPSHYHTLAATGYRESGEEVEGKWPIYPEMAAAGLWTTPEELVQYGIEIQRLLRSKQDGIIKYATAIEMLTAGDNDHGLGPVVKEHFFNHGGADEGFRASLMVWKDVPYTAVVMVNSDNGAIIREIIQAIATEYNLPGVEPTIKNLVELPVDELKKFVGNYHSEESGTFQISLSESRLSIFAVDYEYAMQILPESSSVFFEQQNGIDLTFTLVDGQPEILNWRGITAVRVPDS
ncbi:serine hydrolase domain-containing protein [Aliiglaciecola sp. LCG003]|uniref:serine hydrolase domain-containing protein n=1 Tax=Aliiglaciecola sp. LCG003 TaxID=3053655 RepID=UPI00257383B5|nr:serine hydrolase domain-containing protein [Aliiglaciecola sp. LCG003]WJG08903.1 serine hydrolase domain-containing protein [Aliiglaciecola sp. LCG003]